MAILSQYSCHREINIDKGHHLQNNSHPFYFTSLNQDTIMELDELDRQLLTELQQDGRVSNAELARRLNLSPPATHARIRKLEEQGIIRQYVALLDRDLLGYDLLCFVHIRMHMHELHALESFQEHVQTLPEVLECHHLTGQFDYVLKVALSNRRELQDFIRHKLVPLKGVAQITTSILLEEVKSTTMLPIKPPKK